MSYIKEKYTDQMDRKMKKYPSRYIFPAEFRFKLLDARIGEHSNRETIEAMLEAERIARDPKVKKYSVEEALRELKS
ncbi:MAG: hypothetical protein IJM42_06950 [Synergistes sp.]|nr:hypothetical protein [Synergistes sp.]